MTPEVLSKVIKYFETLASTKKINQVSEYLGLNNILKKEYCELTTSELNYVYLAIQLLLREDNIYIDNLNITMNDKEQKKLKTIIKNLAKLIQSGETDYANEVFAALVDKGMTAEEIYDKLDDIFNN